LDVKGPAFTYLCGKFPGLTYEKVKAGVFIGPQIIDEHGECFRQDISVMGHRYKGKWSAAMLGDYYWMMKRDTPETKYHRQAKGHIVKVSNFLFIFIVHITTIVLLS